MRLEQGRCVANLLVAGLMELKDKDNLVESW